MTGQWLPHAILRAASLFAPGEERADWIREWRSELWYVPRRGATRFCMGAFQDALWLRRNSQSPAGPGLIHLESPSACLAWLATLAALCVAITIAAPGPAKPGLWPSHMSAGEVPGGCLAMLLLTSMLLPATRLAMGRAPVHRHPLPWQRRLRRGLFMALKIALLQPVMLAGFVTLLWLGLLVPIAPTAGLFTTWTLAFRWVIQDQRSRCPVCLRLLTNPVSVGNASHTFLEWYGAESMCSRGHGVLHVPELSASYSGKRRWLRLDHSWSGLFPPAVGVRQR